MGKIYTKTNWTDEVLDDTPAEYKIATINESILLEDVRIELTTGVTAGTTLNAVNLNNIEDGIDDLDDLVDALHDESLYLKVVIDSYLLSAGDGAMVFSIPPKADGYELDDVISFIYTLSSSGLVSIQIHNLTTGHDLLTTNSTIDVGEYNSINAAAPAVVNPTYKVLSAGDRIRIDVDNEGTATRGLDVCMELVRA